MHVSFLFWRDGDGKMPNIIGRTARTRNGIHGIVTMTIDDATDGKSVRLRRMQWAPDVGMHVTRESLFVRAWQIEDVGDVANLQDFAFLGSDGSGDRARLADEIAEGRLAGSTS